VAFAYTITVNDPTAAADDALISQNLTAALNAWGVYLSGRGTLDVTVGVEATSGASSRELASGGSTVSIGVAMDGARTVYRSGVDYELASGRDPNGSTADAEIDLNPTNLKSLFFSSTPGAGSPPAGTYDGLSILEHELGHIFGIDGFRDTGTGALPADRESNWDLLVQVSGRTAAFYGPTAVAVYGGPIPVTTTFDSGEAYYHFANSPTDAASTDLMSGTGLPAGVVRTISPLDVAALADVGAPLSSVGRLDVAASTLLRLKSFADFSSTLTTTIAQLAAQLDGGAALATVQTALAPSAIATTSVATLAYEFFTSKVPTLAGLDYLLSPEGANPNNLNSAYYRSFNTENRYINFAVNLGAQGAGASAFSAAAGPLSLSGVVSSAYGEIFGSTPSAATVAAIVGDAVPNGVGGTETRGQYFASYGQSDLGTKAAAVGWLLALAAEGDTGVYASANDTLVVGLMGASTAQLGTDIVAHHLWLA
jgi:hypothetical protein